MKVPVFKILLGLLALGCIGWTQATSECASVISALE
jgi:hypothetical protein